MLRPNGAADFQAAALVLESIGRHLQPKAAELNASSICYVMSSYVKCRCVGKEAGVCVCWSVCGVQARASVNSSSLHLSALALMGSNGR